LPYRRTTFVGTLGHTHFATASKKGIAMLRQIIVNTPIWVWGLLAFLIYRGFISSVDREIPLKRVLIIPLIMLALSVQDIVSTFGLSLTTAFS